MSWKYDELAPRQRRMVDKATVSSADVESRTCDAPFRAEETPRFDGLARITLRSFRHRLADPDGLAGKYVVDSLVSCGVLKNDSFKEVSEVTHRQVRIPRGEPEYTIVELRKEGAK